MNTSGKKNQVDLVILGAGISGLAAGFYAKKAGLNFKIFEASSRVGGVIRSENRNGFHLEFGPNTVLPTEEMIEMIETLGLKDKMLLANPKTPRFILFGGELHKVPLSPFTLLTSSLLSIPGRLRLLLEPLIRRSQQSADERLLDFGKRRMGVEVAERMLAPFVSGVWAGDASQLSAQASFPSLVKWEKEKGSLFRGLMAQRKQKKLSKKNVPQGLLSFQSGLETWTQSLGLFLRQQTQLNSRVEKIIPPSQNDPTWGVATKEEMIRSSRLIFTIPGHLASGLFKPFSSETVLTLEQIPYAPVAVLHLTAPKGEVTHSLKGFGYLVSPQESNGVLGCLWSSSLFPGRAPFEEILLTVFMGGTHHPDMISLTDDDLMREAVLALQPILGLKKNPHLLSVTRIPNAIPQYTIGHGDRVAELKKAEEKFSGLKFAGNYIGGISVGDVVKRAKEII